MRSLRSCLRRVLLVAAVTVIGATTLLATPAASAAERPITFDDIFAHDGGLQLDGEGLLIDLSTTVDYQPSVRPLHELLYGIQPVGADASQVVLGAPGDLVPDAVEGLIPGAKMLFDKFVEHLEPGAQVFFSLVDPSGQVRNDFRYVGGKIIDETGKVIEDAKIVGNQIIDTAGNVIGAVKDFVKGVSGIVNPGCDWWDWDTVDLKQCFQNAVGLATCFFAPAAIATTFIFEEWGCAAYITRVLKALAAWALSEVLQNLIAQLHEGLRDSVIYLANYTLVEMLGKNRAASFNFSAVVDCNWVPETNGDGSPNDAAQACSTAGKGANGYSSADYWFTGQYRVMRQVGLFLVIPLMMMVVLQSIIKGSLFFLLRSVLVMFPVAVIGSVLLFTVAQIMMNVADDMALYIANSTINGPKAYGEKFIASLAELDSNTFGFFALFWLFMLLLSMLIIFFELMLRQMGIYLTLLFIPVAFAAMVYPATVKFLKRGISLLLALIFMKVFIVAALSMGYAAMASTMPEAGKDEDLSEIINQAILGVIVLLFAGFGGAKILAFTPAAEAASNKIANPTEVLGMGDFTGQQLGKYSGKAMNSIGASMQARGGGGGGGGRGSSGGNAGGGGGGSGARPGRVQQFAYDRPSKAGNGDGPADNGNGKTGNGPTADGKGPGKSGNGPTGNGNGNGNGKTGNGNGDGGPRLNFNKPNGNHDKKAPPPPSASRLKA
jgi:hypothetical protein